LEKEIYYVRVSPATLIASILSVFDVLKRCDYEFVVQCDYEFEVQGDKEKIPLYIETAQNVKIAIQLPPIRDFTNISKAKVYYYLLKISEWITRGLFSHIILIIPPFLVEKSGKIGALMHEFREELLVLEVTEDEACKFIEKTQPIDLQGIFSIPQTDVILNHFFATSAQEIKHKILQDYAHYREKSTEILVTVDENIDDFRDFLLNLNK